MKFVVGIKNGDSWKAVSEEKSILVIKALTQEEVKVVKETTSKIKDKIAELKTENKTKAEIQQIVKDSLVEENEEIVKAEVSDSGDSIWYTFKSGVLGAVSLEEDIQSNKKAFNQSAYESIKKDLNKGTSANISVGNPLVAIFSSHGNTNEVLLEEALKNTNFSVKTFKDGKATVEEFKSISEYGTLVFDTKGESLFKGNLKEDLPYLDEIFSDEDEKVVILTGEKASDASIEKYNADLKTGRLVIVDDYFAITSAFVEHYTKGQNNSMPNSFVYANTNQSMHNQTMAKTFTDNGAQTYLGFAKEAQKSEVVEVIGKMLSNKSVESSVNTAQIYGNKQLVLSIDQKIINGSLEEGLKGWIGKGHIDTITRLGSGNHPLWNTINPSDGNNMGIISSGVDKGALYGRQSWIYQTFTVPTDATNLKFDYNIASSEPMVFIGSGYDDKFKATIVEGVVKEPTQEEGYEEEMMNFKSAKSYSSRDIDSKVKKSKAKGYNSWVENTVDEGEVIIGFESINSSDWGQSFSDDRNRVDVKFPNGDDTTYMTGWKTVNYDVTQYQGKTITLKLQVWDLGDTAYPTAVLFDNIRLTKSNYSGVDIQGRSDIEIPNANKGINEYLYQPGKVDQDGHIQTGKITTYEDSSGFVKPTREFTAKIKMKEEVKGVSLDESTGILSVQSTAQAGNIELTAYDEDGNEKDITVELKEGKKSVPSEINIYGDHYIEITNADDVYSKKYNAIVMDQFGGILTDVNNIEWNLKEAINGITIDSVSGELTIDPSMIENTDTNIILEAYLEDFDISTQLSINLVKKEQTEQASEELKTTTQVITKGVDAKSASATVDTDIVLIAKEAGITGNDISLRLLKPEASDQDLSIEVSEEIITVNLATDSEGNIVSTRQDVIDAINENEDSKALVSAALRVDDSQDSTVDGTVKASASIEDTLEKLTGGKDAVKEVYKLTVDKASKSDGTIAITEGDNTTEVEITADMTEKDIALAIAGAIVIDGYKVTVDNNSVIFESQNPGLVDSLKLVVSNK